MYLTSPQASAFGVDWDAVDAETAHAMQQAFYAQSEESAGLLDESLQGWFRGQLASFLGTEEARGRDRDRLGGSDHLKSQVL